MSMLLSELQIENILRIAKEDQLWTLVPSVREALLSKSLLNHIGARDMETLIKRSALEIDSAIDYLKIRAGLSETIVIPDEMPKDISPEPNNRLMSNMNALIYLPAIKRMLGAGMWACIEPTCKDSAAIFIRTTGSNEQVSMLATAAQCSSFMAIKGPN